jgi:hypothetical protein
MIFVQVDCALEWRLPDKGGNTMHFVEYQLATEMIGEALPQLVASAINATKREEETCALAEDVVVNFGNLHGRAIHSPYMLVTVHHVSDNRNGAAHQKLTLEVIRNQIARGLGQLLQGHQEFKCFGNSPAWPARLAIKVVPEVAASCELNFAGEVVSTSHSASTTING